MEVESERSAETSLGVFFCKTSRSSSCDSMAGTMPSGGILASRKQFRFSLQIINAISVRMGFDGGVERCGEERRCLPACIGGGIGVLMKAANQTGAGL